MEEKKLKKQLTAGLITVILFLIVLINVFILYVIVQFPERVFLTAPVLISMSIFEIITLIIVRRNKIFEWVSFFRPDGERISRDDLKHIRNDFFDWTYTTNNKDQLCYKGSKGDEILYVSNRFLQGFSRNKYMFMNMEYRDFYKIYWPMLKEIEKSAKNRAYKIKKIKD